MDVIFVIKQRLEQPAGGLGGPMCAPQPVSDPSEMPQLSGSSFRRSQRLVARGVLAPRLNEPPATVSERQKLEIGNLKLALVSSGEWLLASGARSSGECLVASGEQVTGICALAGARFLFDAT